MFASLSVIVVFALLIIFLLFSSIKILQEYERAVVFRLGRYAGVRGPGLIILIPILEQMVKVNMRTIVMDVPPQDISLSMLEKTASLPIPHFPCNRQAA